ncbi:MAG: ABC transporter ATP-binding protein [Chloroflexi bacterium]|nr:ABC transporter ATP-binding protein [Chloroflexota bacterium]
MKTGMLKRYSNFLVQYLRPLKRQVALLAVLIFAMIGLQLVNPQIIRYFIDTAMAAGTTGAQTTHLLWAAVIFIVAALILQGISVAATYVGEDIGWRATNQLRNDLALHCLSLDMTFHNSHTPGEMIERIDGDIIDIAVFFAQFILRVLGNVLLLFGVIVVLLWEDWRISGALAVYTVISLISFYYMRRIAIPFWEANRQAAADLFGFLEENLSGTEDIRASGAVNYVLRNLFKFSKARLEREIKGGNMEIWFGGMWFVLATLGQLVAFSAGYWQFRQGLITLGTVYLIVYYTDRILQPLNEITNQFQNVQKAAAGINRVEALYALTSKIQDQGEAKLNAGPLTVDFSDVTFGYVATEPVLHNISFELPRKQILGVLGRTGSGKTTLTRLLYRLYDPTAGNICLGASEQVDIRQMPVAELRGRIGMVTQDVQLFRATVRENLTFFNPEISDDRILAVIDELELREWVDRLPNGLDTELQAEGSSLSAGEAQLLAFTRVFLQDPGLVILDEASSRLDPATERLIERAVDKLLQNRTGIIVAHRLSTVQRADHILILQDGCIQEYGVREQLANDPTSRFHALLQTGLEEVLV